MFICIHVSFVYSDKIQLPTLYELNPNSHKELIDCNIIPSNLYICLVFVLNFLCYCINTQESSCSLSLFTGIHECILRISNGNSFICLFTSLTPYLITKILLIATLYPVDTLSGSYSSVFYIKHAE